MRNWISLGAVGREPGRCRHSDGRDDRFTVEDTGHNLRDGAHRLSRLPAPSRRSPRGDVPGARGLVRSPLYPLCR